ncbi:MAG: site-2 protease family protein [Myxococcales bacterium]
MEPNPVQDLVLVLVPMILSLTVHEFAHAATARALGDRTAESQGRLTLNPVSHIDPFGTLLLPAILVLSGSGFFFGWARPVPYDPRGFRASVGARLGTLLTAAAGPASNLVLAVLAALVLNIALGGVASTSPAAGLLVRMVFINVILALFNLIPMPPLDGSKVLHSLFPGPVGRVYARLQQNPLVGMGVFLMVVLLAGRIIGPPTMMLVRALIH